MSSLDGKIGPEKPLPYNSDFATTEEYVDSLLHFVGTNDLLRTLCGGVHILDFFTSTPSIYSQILPPEWQAFFAAHQVMDLLDLMIRDELFQCPSVEWKDGPPPPEDFVEYIRDVRKHFLQRTPNGSQCSRNRAIKPTQRLARHVTVGMNIKKIHEVGLFASYINELTDSVSARGINISHLVDFGSGQNYLGRALASEPYNQDIVAVESRQANAERARALDVMAKLATKEKRMRNKKLFRAGLDLATTAGRTTDSPALQSEEADKVALQGSTQLEAAPHMESPRAGTGRIQYVEHRIEDGDLTKVLKHLPQCTPPKGLMVMSLHSCGNLVHHGLRSLVLNPEVRAVALVGCCYNLITERLGPATYKLPGLRPSATMHPRLKRLGEAYDPHGFPMSSRCCGYNTDYAGDDAETGIRLNITARMMAVQAPSNWGLKDSEDFFQRHFYRALLQRIFLDHGVIGPPKPAHVGGQSPAGHSSGGTPIVIGSLRKDCYKDFVAYVRGALTKLAQDPERGELFRNKMSDLTDAEIKKYETKYMERKKELSVVWSLMAFSAGVIEAAIVVDRWLWLKEQGCVQEAWVEPIFDYRMSPRNLVVVGIKNNTRVS